MSMRSARRLPRKFTRPVSPDTRRFVERKMQRRRRHAAERWRRLMRRIQVVVLLWRKVLLRWGIALLAMLFLFAAGMILFSPLLTVRAIEVIRESPRLDIEQAVQALAPVYGKKMLLLPAFEVEDLLRTSIPDLRDVSVSKAFPSTLRVRVTLDPLVAKLKIVSPDTPDRAESASGSTFDFLTAEGIYVATSPGPTTKALPEITVVDWGVRPQPGTLLIPPEFISRLTAAEVILLRQFGQESQKRVVYLRAQEFHLLIENNIALWFDLKSTIEEHMQRYRIFLKEIGMAKVKEYIDLRVEGRVLYK